MSLHYYPWINKFLTTLKLRNGSEMPFQEDYSSFVKPFITIAREPGSGGKPIAKAVADLLGLEFVDEQIIDEIATSTKKRKEIIKAVDEKARGAIDDIVHSLLNSEYIDDMTYVSALIKVIFAYAHRGHVVILGRGANFITPFARGLHVNIVAPHDIRIKRAMEFEGHTEEVAKQVVDETTRERNEFVKKYFKNSVRSRFSYDLTINTTYFQVDEAAKIIAEAYYQKFSRSVRYGAVLKK